LKQIAQRVHTRTKVLADGLKVLGWTAEQSAFFDTITINAGVQQTDIIHRAAANGINLRKFFGSHRIGISCDETTTPEQIEAVWRAFGPKQAGAAEPLYANIAAKVDSAFSADLSRSSAFMTHPVFHRHRSETEMLRYMRRLADRDLALDRAMIPLGSCTMKLNATSEMLPITWPEVSALHPFAPAEQARGYAELLDNLCRQLCVITGYDAVSLQPN
jgi:glycine dehydrogenase